VLEQRRADLPEVVRGDVGRHADRDTGRAVEQEVGDLAREDNGLFLRAVVVRAEVNGALPDLAEHLGGDGREAALGVSHRGGGVAVERAEVARSIHERSAHHERLAEADEGFVDRAIAVGVIAAHDRADDIGALAVLGIGAQPALPHGVEDASLHGLQPVAHVGQGAAGDDGERVVEVARLGDVEQRRRLLNAGGRGIGWVVAVAAVGLAGFLRFKTVE
jgi:hypothetical protein